MKRSPHLLVFLLIIGCGRVANLNAGDAAGLDLGLGNLYHVSKAKSRSISPENFTGEKGKAGMATGLVSVPLRYMHTPCEVLSLEDLENACRLCAAFARRITAEMVWTL